MSYSYYPPPHFQESQDEQKFSQSQQELTQLLTLDEEDDPNRTNLVADDTVDHNNTSTTPSINLLELPWAKLVPYNNTRSHDYNRTSSSIAINNGGGGFDLLPREPSQNIGSITRSSTKKSMSLSSSPLSSNSPNISNNNIHSPSHTLSNNNNTNNFTSPTAPIQNDNNQYFHLLGLEKVKLGDRFNEYVIGRSPKCDFVIPKRSNTEHKWIHVLISNMHCRIFCMINRHNILNTGTTTINNNAHAKHLATGKHNLTTSTTNTANTNTTNQLSSCHNVVQDMEVYIEDTSGNGTFINNTIQLQRGERRILHTGDTICLVNPSIIRKKIGNNILQQDEIINYYSFIFINIFQTQYRGGANNGVMDYGAFSIIPSTLANSITSNNNTHHHPTTMQPPRIDKQLFPPTPQQTTPPIGSNIRKRGLVDVRAMNNKSILAGVVDNHGIINSSTPNNNNNNKSTFTSMIMSSSSNKRTRLSPPIPNSQTTTQHKNNLLHPNNNNPNIDSNVYLRRIEEHYDLRDEIGSGTSGLVRRAIHRRSGEIRAVKIISIAGNNKGNYHQQQQQRKSDRYGIIDPNIQAEISLLQALKYPYIVNLIDVFVHPHNSIYLVMELLHGGDLFDRIIERENFSGGYGEQKSRMIMRRILSALHYLHEIMDVVHRDLKPENILCVSRNDDISIKLTDFGLAKPMTAEGLKTFCGTPQYFAPEVLCRRHTVAGKGRYGKEADMWSLGVILYILLCGVPPFDVSDSMDIVAQAKITFREKRWSNVSDDAKDLVKKLLIADPWKRISVVDACAHPWFLVQDGDTHTFPLDDPNVHGLHVKPISVINELPINTSNKMTTPPHNSPPQSENNSPGPSTPIPCEENMISKLNNNKLVLHTTDQPSILPFSSPDVKQFRYEDGSSPHNHDQSANFPSPRPFKKIADDSNVDKTSVQKNADEDGGGKSQRSSLFSCVKQDSYEESANITRKNDDNIDVPVVGEGDKKLQEEGNTDDVIIKSDVKQDSHLISIITNKNEDIQPVDIGESENNRMKANNNNNNIPQSKTNDKSRQTKLSTWFEKKTKEKISK